MPDGGLEEHVDKGASLQTPIQGRSSLVYILACILGSLLLDTFSATGTFALLGTMLLSYGATVLMNRRKTPLACLLIVVIGVGGALYDPPGGVCSILLGTIVIVMARSFTKRRFGQMRYIASALLMALVMLLADVMTAYLAGTTFTGQLTAMVDTTMQQVTAAGTVPAETLTVMKNSLTTLAALWPSIYVVQGLICALFVILIGKLAVRRHVPEADTIGFTGFDLSIHTLIVLILALACLAASFYDVRYSKVIAVVGYNLLVCAAMVYAIQGFAVCANLMRKAGWNWVVRVLIYLLLAQMELMFLLPTFIGLVDLWVNFRKLPRSGTPAGDTSGGMD